MVSRRLPRTAHADALTSTSGGEEVTFRPEVVAKIAGMATCEVNDVTLASMPGLMPLLFRAAPDAGTRVRRAVRARLDGKTAIVDVWLKVAYGTPIPDLVRNVRQSIRRRLDELAEVRDVQVNVHVTDVLLPSGEAEDSP